MTKPLPPLDYTEAVEAAARALFGDEDFDAWGPMQRFNALDHVRPLVVAAAPSLVAQASSMARHPSTSPGPGPLINGRRPSSYCPCGRANCSDPKPAA